MGCVAREAERKAASMALSWKTLLHAFSAAFVPNRNGCQIPRILEEFLNNEYPDSRTRKTIVPASWFLDGHFLAVSSHGGRLKVIFI